MAPLMCEPGREKRQRRHELEAEMLSKAGSPLTGIDWRLLHWLLHYPLQRADDLVVGVARWASRATVYRHLQELEANGLVESVVPATPARGKRLYHLSNLGLHVLASQSQAGRSARDLAHQWQADEAGLLRLLPRLPVLLVIQEVVNGLVTGAAEAMTNQGCRPQLVRWTWQRNVTYRFQYREQAMGLFVEGAAALCIRTRQKDGDPLDHWYGLLLLYTHLDNERLMRLRLERLLCWRECPERWSLYQHMSPVLILAASPRQREHWQHAVETSALKLRLEPLQGALTCLPGTESGREDPWRFAWHTLSGSRPCHLRDLLKPLPPAALLPTLSMEEGEEEGSMQSTAQTREAPAPAEKIVRLVRGNLARRAITVTRGDPEGREVLALLGLRLTTRHWSVLHLLLAHPLLSDEELAALLNLKRKSVRCSLYELHRLGCLESIPAEVGKRWHLCERGLRLLAAASHLHIRNLASRPEDETDTNSSSTVVHRGEAWLLSHIQHTAGIYGFFAGLARAARQHPEQALCWWETGAICERRYQVGEQWYNLRPDALAEYRVGSRQMRFWLEWDCGTMNAHDLGIKFASYAHYIASREWAVEGAMLPMLICVAPELGQERRMQRITQTWLAQTYVEVRTTTEVLLSRSGPLAPIWWWGVQQRDQVMRPDDSGRQGLFGTLAEKVVVSPN